MIFIFFRKFRLSMIENKSKKRKKKTKWRRSLVLTKWAKNGDGGEVPLEKAELRKISPEIFSKNINLRIKGT